jgi:sucrose phosphorylase
MVQPLDSQQLEARLENRLARLYGPDSAAALMEEIRALLGQPPSADRRALPLSQRDMVLITYGDMVSREDEAPLATLHHFLKETIAPDINSVHILPFYPYSSDDGFSVIDYYAVNPQLGDWPHLHAMRHDFRLMFDAVFNHISAESAWFAGFLNGVDPYRNYFITADPTADLSLVRRPRALPLLTRFDTADGEQWVWTTFSADQIDLNASNPAVLMELIRALVFYVRQGADLIRLDAIAYLWKIVGTSCIHLEQTHEVVRALRDVLDWFAPETILITETNVPHSENVSYLGNGHDEAQMVYNFSLPPLLVHTFLTGSARALTRWAATLTRVSNQTTFFNFTASHDGIGVTPLRGLLTDDEIDAVVAMAESHGGYVSYKNDSDGTRSPYELNVTYFDAITHPDVTAADPETAVARFIVSQAIMLALMGIPGIYFHSLFGSRNWRDGVEETGRYRTINRQKFPADDLRRELTEPRSIRVMVYDRYMALIRARAAEPAFHPLGDQDVPDLGDSVFALRRRYQGAEALALHNVTGAPVTAAVPGDRSRWRDIISGSSVQPGPITLRPYQILWLKPA